MGRRIWVVIQEYGGTYDCRVLSFRGFFPAGRVVEGEPPSRGGIRKKHLVQLWTDPGGMRTLTVGSIRLKDPGRAAAMRARHDSGEFDQGDED